MKSIYKVKKYGGAVFIALPIMVFCFIHFVINAFFTVTIADKKYNGQDRVPAAISVNHTPDSSKNKGLFMESIYKQENPCPYVFSNIEKPGQQQTPLYYKYLLGDSVYKKKAIAKPDVDQVEALTKPLGTEQAILLEEEEVAWYPSEELSGTDN